MSSDIASGIIRRLQADRDRMDFLQSNDYSLRKLDFLTPGEQQVWVLHLNYRVLSTGKTVRAAIDRAMKLKKTKAK